MGATEAVATTMGATEAIPVTTAEPLEVLDIAQCVTLDNYEVKAMGSSGKVKLSSTDGLCTSLTLEAGGFDAVAVDKVTGKQTKLNQFNIAQLDKDGWTAVVDGGMTTLELVAKGHSGLTGITVTYIYEACGSGGTCLTAGGKFLDTNQVELTFEVTGLAEWSEGADAVYHEFTFKESAGCDEADATDTTEAATATTTATVTTPRPGLDVSGSSEATIATLESTVSTATPQVTTTTPQEVSFGLEFVVDFDPSAMVNGVEIEATISNSADATTTTTGPEDSTVDPDGEDEDVDSEEPEDPDDDDDSTKTTITFGFSAPGSGDESTSTDTSIDTIVYDPTITYTAGPEEVENEATEVENEATANMNGADTAGPMLSLGFLGVASALALLA